MRFLGLDIGTTRIKCGIYAENGSLLYSDGEEYGVRQWERETCLDIEGLQRCVKKLLKRAYSRFPFDCVAISSLISAVLAQELRHSKPFVSTSSLYSAMESM